MALFRNVPTEGNDALLVLGLGRATPPWAFGLACAMLGYICSGAGMNIIKLAHLKRAGPPSTLAQTRWNRRCVSPARTRVLWLFGYLVNAVGGALNLLGLRFAAQSMLAPLSSLALVANILCATVMLGERFRIPSDVLPMLCIAVGNVLAVSSANHHSQTALTLEEIGHLFQRPQFRLYIASVSCLLIVLLLLRAKLHRQIRRDGGGDFASPTLLARAGLCHAAAAAMLSVNTVFLAKASLLALADGYANALQPRFAVIALTWLSLVIFWIYTLNSLLRSYDALYIVPVIEVLWGLCSMISGGVFFQEYADLGWSRKLSFGAGACINFAGIMMLSRRDEKSSKIG